MLELAEIHTYYAQSHILQGISLAVHKGEVVAFLGRNGAGKTTTLRSIMGLTPPRRGTVRFDGADITRRKNFEIARLGIAYVPSGRRVFSQLTVSQNLLLAAHRAPGTDGWTLDQVNELFPALTALGGRRAAYLSGGEQQMLKLGRALVSNPRLLLLDEPTEGLAPTVVAHLAERLQHLKDHGLSMVLCEQNALFALRLADRGYVLEKGRIRHEGAADALRESAEVRTYLAI